MNRIYGKIMTSLRLLKSERGLFLASCLQHFFQWLPDEIYLKLLFRFMMGYKLDLKNPKTFSEKLQWLKLYDRKSEYTTMVDKYAVKQYVTECLGAECIIPTLGVWNRFEDIDFAKLPQQFVLKTTHGGGGGGVVICRDKSTFNKVKAQRIIERSMESDIYNTLREWPYKNVQKRIIAEKFMTSIKQPTQKDLTDYKFFCFHGEPLYCQVIRDRFRHETIDFYDMDWNHQEFVGLNPVVHSNWISPVSNGLIPVERPVHFEEMLYICRRLSKNILFLRVDLFVIDDKVYFGEITFYPASGMGIFTPNEWNYVLGNMLHLPLI